MKPAMKTHLKVAKGLGSAQSGTEHFLLQRISAILLVPLCLWFLFQALTMSHASYDEARLWVSHTFNAIALAALILTVLFHLKLGLQVVIEDYVHAPMPKVLAVLAVTVFCWLAGIIGILSILSIKLGGA